MPGTFFSCDVALMTVASPGATTAPSLLEIFTDSEVSIDNEVEEARAVHDLVDSAILGFPFNEPKARTWSVRLGAVLDPSGTPGDPRTRMFGWDMTLVEAGSVDATRIFTRAQVRITNETAEARAVNDTNPVTRTAGLAPGVAGWRSPRIMRRTLEMETDGVVIAGAGGGALFESLLDAWPTDTSPTALSYSLMGGGINIGGDGVLVSGSLRYPSEAAEQSLRIVAQGPPQHLEVVPTPNLPVMILSAIQNTPFFLQLGRPSGGTNVYAGFANLTEASLEAPDSACLQGATFTGVSALTKATYTALAPNWPIGS